LQTKKRIQFSIFQGNEIDVFSLGRKLTRACIHRNANYVTNETTALERGMQLSAADPPGCLPERRMTMAVRKWTVVTCGGNGSIARFRAWRFTLSFWSRSSSPDQNRRSLEKTQAARRRLGSTLDRDAMNCATGAAIPFLTAHQNRKRAAPLYNSGGTGNAVTFKGTELTHSDRNG
jgi:hypothetical protein